MWQPTGSTIWARQTIESDIFLNKPADWFKIWFFLISRVNFKDHEQYKRGQCHTSYQEIMSYTRASRSTVDHCIRFLKSATMITTEKATRGFYVFVVKFAQYQDAIKTKSDTKSEVKATQKRHKSDTIKNKNNKNKNNKQYNNLRAKPESAVLTEEEMKEKKKNEQIQEVLDLFYNTINPNINFGNTTTRKACQFLIDKYGIDATKRATEYAISIQGQPYSPTITTPHELKEKMSKLILYKQKDENITKGKGKEIIGL